MKKIVIIVLAFLTFSLPVFSQDESFGSAGMHYTNSGRVMVNLDAMNLPETVFDWLGREVNVSYCLILGETKGYSYIYHQTYMVDGNTVTHINQGGKSGMTNVRLTDGHFNAILNIPINSKPDQVTVFLSLARAPTNEFTAEEANAWDEPICEYLAPELARSFITLRAGEKKEVDLIYNPY